MTSLRLDVPKDFPETCPGLTAVLPKLDEFVAGERLPTLATDPFEPTNSILAILALAAGLLGLGIGFLHCPTVGLRQIGRGALWIVLVSALAIPFAIDKRLALIVELAVAWVLFALLLYARRQRRETARVADSRRTPVAELALFSISCLVHGYFATGGPGDLHLNLSPIWSNSFEYTLRWGPAPIALGRLLDWVIGGIRDTHLVYGNVLLSSIAPVLLFAAMVELGIAAPAAWLGALAMSLHPIFIAFSGVMERQPAYLFAVTGSLLLFCRYLRSGSLLDLAGFFLGSILAGTCRPEGMHVLAIYGAVMLVMPSTSRNRFTGALVIAVLTAVGLGYTRLVLGGEAQFHSLLQAEPTSLSSTLPILGTILFLPDFMPRVWIVAWIAGLLVGLRRRVGWVVLLSVGSLDLGWRVMGLYRMFVDHERQVASARYETILLVPFALAMALLAEFILSWGRRARYVALVLFVIATVAGMGPPYETLLTPFTVDHEYHFLKRHALTLPPRSSLYIFDSPLSDVGFLDAEFVGQFVGSEVVFLPWRERRCAEMHEGDGPIFLYLGSSCAPLLDNDPKFPLPSPLYGEWLQACRQMRDRVKADVIEEIEVPAHKMAWNDFQDPLVRLGLYRLRDPSLCEIGPRMESGQRRVL